MSIFSCALALLCGAVGAGFASGREITRFFAVHGAMAPAAVACTLMTLCLLLIRLPSQMERCGANSLASLCRIRFGKRLGRLCSALFYLLMSLTGGAMLAACAEVCALTLPIRGAYALGIAASLLPAGYLASRGAKGIAFSGALLLAFLPALLFRLLWLDTGEACFLPAMSPDLPVRAAADGILYAALNAAMLCGMLPLLLSLHAKKRRRAVLLFTFAFGLLLSLGTAVCRRHYPAALTAPMPFVYLSRALGAEGYLLVAACLYAAAFSTLCAMLCGLCRLCGKRGFLLPAMGGCLLFSLIGFGELISAGYPMLGAVCAGLMLLLCFPCQEARQSER